MCEIKLAGKLPVFQCIISYISMVSTQ